MVLGIPDEALLGGTAAIIALVIALRFLGGKKDEKKPVEPEAGGVETEKHTDLEDLIDKPAITKLPGPETIDEEETAGMSVPTDSIQPFLDQPIDAAPSIGLKQKTDVEAGLENIPFEKPVEAKPDLPPEVKHEKEQEKKKETEQIPSSAKDLKRLHKQFGEEFNIDSLGDIIAVPQPTPKYVPPKDIEEKAEKEASAQRPVRLYDKPRSERKEKLDRYCMLEYDAGKPPKKVENLLRVKGTTPNNAKQLAFKNYKIWLEKREPVIRQIKETREMIKRIEYKFLKRRIDTETRKTSLNEANKKLAELEAKLKASEDYFN